MPFRSSPAALLLAAAFLLGVILALMFPDSCQQDGGYHFLFSRWAWSHPELFVGVWARPLFTTLYAVPALHSYFAAKALTVIISVIIAYQTFRLAAESQLDRPHLAIALLYLQPSFFIISADTLTEPIFALVFVIALRLHRCGRRRAGMIVASLMILARPEGFFIGLLWGVWILLDKRDDRSLWRRLPSTLWLATGAVIWWLAAWAITRDPLFIKNNWPSGWPMTGTIYGTGAWTNYLVRLPEIVGALLIPPFVLGLWRLLKQRRLGEEVSVFLLFFLLHTILRAYGLLGSAGYPRYFVAISPAIALITLEGWNALAPRFAAWPDKVRAAGGGALLAISLVLCFAYFDGADWIRDARAVDEMHGWFAANAVPMRRFIWSEAYMCIRFDRDPWENPGFSGDRGKDLEMLRASEPGTVVLWDSIYGPKWHGLKPSDFIEAGYRQLHSRRFVLRGYLLPRSFFGHGGPRHQEMFLFYKNGQARD